MNPGEPDVYWRLLNQVHDYISTWTSRTWQLGDNLQLASFLGYLQHHGFPTPLLDWTESPYVAAYFAFEGVSDATPQSDAVAIYAFDHAAWQRDWKQIYDVHDRSAHVSLLHSQSMGNQKQLLQQGVYNFSTVRDQQEHIEQCEQRLPSGPTKYVWKWTLSVHEKPKVLRDLGLMGITAMTLFPGVEGVCRHLRNALFPASRLGLTPSERTAEFMLYMKELAAQRALDEGSALVDSVDSSPATDTTPRRTQDPPDTAPKDA